MSRVARATNPAVVIQTVFPSASIPETGRIRHWITVALGGERRTGEITVRVVGESESATLNERFRHGAGATNVLAFPYGDTQVAELDEPPPLGDLVICAPVVEREAESQGKSLDAHWAHISIHGTLHLLGYDHESAADAQVMEDRERELLAGLGFADPYAGGS